MVRPQRMAILILTLALLWSSTAPGTVQAQEVDKGKIPADQLELSFKTLPWGAPIWDVPEAVSHLVSGGKVLWVDTRPESFYAQGTVKGAVLLVYDKKGSAGNTLTADSLAKALTDAGLTKENATIAFFCQGPECHRSYNATFVAISEWGYTPSQVVWFRAGYPHLLQDVKNDAKLKRKANQYLSETGVSQL